MMDSPHKTSTTIQSGLREARALLSAQGIESSGLEAELLLRHVLEVRKEDLILHAHEELTQRQEEHYRQLLQRRCRREPLAYITGRREFWSLDFTVNPKVLIPRPETEGVIERMLELTEDGTHEDILRVLDMGTGSGILAVVAAVEFPKVRVMAVDCSADALAVARDNALRHQVVERIEFLLMDMMKPWNLKDNGQYDFILSNPPYIPSQEIERLMPDIRDYEPRTALEGGPDGLACYQHLIPNAFDYLKPGGHLIVEVGDGQAESVAQKIQAYSGFEKIKIIQDLNGMGRVVSARRGHG
jgi:release factor glutamine methyltransferase